MTPSFTIQRIETGADRGELRLGGSLTLAEAGPLWEELRRLESSAARGQSLDFELSAVERIDGGAMALLACLRAELQRRGVRSEFVAAGERVQRVVHLYGGDARVARLRSRRPLGTFDQLGRATLAVLREVQLALAFLGQMTASGVALLRSPRSANWRELPATMERSGADAVPIVVLINFLVGLAMAFQASAQFRRYGANIYVADLIGISVSRELGPLMTAIVLCGRSGAAFTAELGFMRVNEEIDALRTMGLGPMRYLVLPRTLALVLVLPLLVLLADVAGVLGGLVVGVWNLDLTPRGYLNETIRAVSVWDVASGLVKSVVFALAIALIGCQQGLATTGGAEGVGRRTTAAVVTTLFTLILADAALTALFRLGGM
ncbi:MAG: MlaE family lipid ABC transporter permease subunit [Deltaproteobacteria bacterium]|nr:MlaE family lipid ABC transporter permease subunit [Deltaproteobacteria bacterium]